MNQWKAWAQVALLGGLLVLLFVLGWLAKREVVRQVRQELQQQLAEDVRQLRETASKHRRQLEEQIQGIQAQAAIEVCRDPVEVANELLVVLRSELGTGTGTGE